MVDVGKVINHEIRIIIKSNEEITVFKYLIICLRKLIKQFGFI